MDNLTITHNTSSLEKAWEGIQNAKPGIRIREAATELGVSEAELLATTIGKECVRLEGDWTAFVKRLPALGKVMSLTRNNSCVLEHKGTFQKVNTFGANGHQMGTVIGPIETRIFFKSWHVAFGIQQKKEDRTLTSLQVFDHEGHAITKIYLQDEGDWDAFESILKDFESPDQSPAQRVSRYEEEQFVDTIDTEAFLTAWTQLVDTHDFFSMLKKFNVQRHRAVELAEGRFSYRVKVNSLEQILNEASSVKLPIMIFAGNRSNLQIHQGKVNTIRMLDRGEEQWLNVLDPAFNMHLRLNDVDSTWVVVKPTKDGDVTSIEVFDKHNEMIVQFFGLRKPGLQELDGWRALIGKLEKV